ncbi:MAG: DUF2798 domain-containing protein [Halocynthiibacter sp.]
MFPAKLAPVLFGLIVSGLMTFIVSLISTLKAIGFVDGFGPTWMGAWILSWIVAFPVILFVAPLARKLVGKLVKPAA